MVKPALTTCDDIEAVERELLSAEQVDCEVTHRFAPGVYMREIFMPAGTVVLGHKHLTMHHNVVLSGSAWVVIDGVSQYLQAPLCFVSEAGVRKALLIEKDMRFMTVHPIDQDATNWAPEDQKRLAEDVLEDQLIEKSKTWRLHYDAKSLEASLRNGGR